MISASRKSHIVSVFLAVMGAGHAAYAIWGDKPWSKEIARRVSTGKSLSLNHYITIGVWYAAVAGAVMLLAAAGLLWWSRRLSASQPAVAIAKPLSGSARHGFWWAMIGIFALALTTRVPRLHHSLWNDELMAMEMFVIGEPHGKDAHHDYSTTWQRAIYGNPDTNNHVVCTIQSRLSHKLWQSIIGPSEGRTFDEAWLRFPSLLWGMAGIALASWLGMRLGGPRLSIILAFLVTVHPWSIRFSTETRGYSAAMAGVLLVMIALHSVLTDGSRRWQIWALLATGLVLSMLSHAACAPVLAGLVGATALILLYRRDWHSLAALVAANALAATVFLDLFGPSLPQMSAFMKGKANARLSHITLSWWHNIASAFTCGEDWHLGHRGMGRMPMIQRVGLLAGCYGLVLTGLVCTWRKGAPVLKALTAAWVVAVVLVLAMNVFSAHAMLSWYLCPLLPGMALCMAIGCTQAPRTAGVLALLWLTFLIPVGWHQITEDRQPIRQAAEFITARWPSAITAYFGISDTFVGSYLPTTHVLDRSPGHDDQVAQLQSVQQQAIAAQLPCVVWFGGNQEPRSPEAMEYLRSQGFTQQALFRGSYEVLDVTVYAKPAQAQ